MMPILRSDLTELSIFMAVSRHLGFRRAAQELRLSPSAVSHAIRSLESKRGVRLFNRTHRTVTLTDAGEALTHHLTRGFQEIETGLEAMNQFSGLPVGRLRLNVLSDAARILLAAELHVFMQRYPDVELEVVVQDKMVDIVAEGFDAGIRFGGTVPEDMIGMNIGHPLRWMAVASPQYLEHAPALGAPEDLKQHRCIGLRMGTGSIYRWEFERGEEETSVSLRSMLTVSETALAIEVAESGGGIAYCLEERVRAQLDAGTLVEVLPEWSPMGPSFQIYYSSRRQVPAALRRLVELLRH